MEVFDDGIGQQIGQVNLSERQEFVEFGESSSGLRFLLRRFRHLEGISPNDAPVLMADCDVYDTEYDWPLVESAEVEVPTTLAEARPYFIRFVEEHKPAFIAGATGLVAVAGIVTVGTLRHRRTK